VILFFSGVGKNSGLIMIISHGYVSVIIFYLVGEIVHFLGVRIVYYFHRLFFSNYLVSVILAIIILINRGLPLSLSFFSELFGIFSSMLFIKWSILLLFLYFILSFYYSLYIVIFIFLGKGYLKVNIFVGFFLLPYLLIGFNVFFYILV
jgi:NADH:ubiquinone oxidoreductase subunit 4 (subunit M)